MKKWNVVASCLLGIGTVMMIGSLAACKGVQNLSVAKYTTETYEITENIQNISIETITADVKILPASDGVNKVVSFEREKADPKLGEVVLSVENLTVKDDNKFDVVKNFALQALNVNDLSKTNSIPE